MIRDSNAISLYIHIWLYKEKEILESLELEFYSGYYIFYGKRETLLFRLNFHWLLYDKGSNARKKIEIHTIFCSKSVKHYSLDSIFIN